MTSCTHPTCRERAVRGLRWTEELTTGWQMTSERIFCGYHADEAVAQLEHRGIKVTYTNYGTPVV